MNLFRKKEIMSLDNFCRYFWGLLLDEQSKDYKFFYIVNKNNILYDKDYKNFINIKPEFDYMLLFACLLDEYDKKGNKNSYDSMKKLISKGIITAYINRQANMKCIDINIEKFNNTFNDFINFIEDLYIERPEEFDYTTHVCFYIDQKLNKYPINSGKYNQIFSLINNNKINFVNKFKKIYSKVILT